MKRVNSLAVLFWCFLGACSFAEEEKKEVQGSVPKEGECPKGHTEDVIPIVYGLPTKEYFQKADSGLVILAGCILPENPKYHFCKKHKMEF